MTTQHFGARIVTAGFSAPVLRPTRDSVRGLALAVALAIGLHLISAPARARAGRIVLAGLAAQGAIGYAQYFSHLPAGLVWVHVTMSAVLWILVVRLYLSTRERQPPPAAATQAGTAPAAGNSQAPGVTPGAEEGTR